MKEILALDLCDRGFFEEFLLVSIIILRYFKNCRLEGRFSCYLWSCWGW